MSRLNHLPVIIGAGQDSRPVPDDLDKAFGPADLAGRALSRAFEDAGIAPQALDICFGVRLFGDSGLVFPNPFGGSNNFPASICARAGASAEWHVYDHVGGQTPQTLVGESAQLLMDGKAKLIAITGAEAAANIRAALCAGAQPDWIETRNEPLDDRGPTPLSNDGIGGFAGFLIHQQAISHRISAPIYYYALMESARRWAMGETKVAYRDHMSVIWQKFSAVALVNPYSFVRQSVLGPDIVRPGPDNPIITTPYTKAMVARDGVNLGAAVILSTYEAAKRLGVPTDQMTFLHAHDQCSEPPLLQRARLDRAEAQQRVLDSTAHGADMYDLYSCFPVIPLEASRILGLTDQPQSLTGGLPFFGGPGNNYSLHAIAEAHHKVRGSKQTAVVYANGGLSSKHAAGLYCGVPPSQVTLRQSPNPDLSVRVEEGENPSGTIAAYTVEYRRGEPMGVLLIGETDAGARFYARGGIGLTGPFIEGDPLGETIQTETKAEQNLLTGI